MLNRLKTNPPLVPVSAVIQPRIFTASPILQKDLKDGQNNENPGLTEEVMETNVKIDTDS